MSVEDDYVAEHEREHGFLDEVPAMLDPTVSYVPREFYEKYSNLGNLKRINEGCYILTREEKVTIFTSLIRGMGNTHRFNTVELKERYYDCIKLLKEVL